MKGIIGLGNPLIDIAIDGDDNILESFNLKKGRFHEMDTSLIYKLMGTSNYKIFPGDSTANAIATCALNNLKEKGDFKISYIGKIGNDRDGNFYDEELKKLGVKTFLIKGKKPTGVCLTIITEDSERTFAVDLGSSITLSKEDIENNNLIEEIKKHDVFHFTGYQLADPTLKETLLYIIDKVKFSTEISFDCGDPNVVEGQKDLIKELLPTFKIVFANKDEATALFGDKSAEELCNELHEHTSIAIVKDGIKGSYIHDGILHKIKPYPVEAVDTTGAGDVYAGTVLYYYLKGENMDIAGDKASLYSAEVVKKKGGRLDRLPDQD